MKISNLVGKRSKEKPSDITLKSHEFLVRGGYIKSLSSGIYSLLPLGVKVVRNIEKIVREEMNKLNCNETEMPLVQPKELWEESGRFNSINTELVKLKDRTNRDFVLAMTHEESATSLVRDFATTYKDYPFSIYQIAKKFRDEARPRGGLIRVKEFTMKDAYSFHTNEDSLNETYQKFMKAYHNIFNRIGLPEVVSILSDNGVMGGQESHEFMLLCDSGEDTIITCPKCDYKANKEIAEFNIEYEKEQEKIQNLEKVFTPNIKSIEDLSNFFNLPLNKFLKTLIIKTKNDIVLVLLRGDRELNENKLIKVIQEDFVFANDYEIKEKGLTIGFASPYKINDLKIIADISLKNSINLIAGSNEENYHFKNFNLKRDFNINDFYDISNAQYGDRCPKCNELINFSRGIEVANIFKLGEKYTKPMNMRYLDNNNILKTPVMGCYGIGITRLIASFIEAKHDETGPIWSYAIAPYKISIIVLNTKECLKIAEDIYIKAKKITEDILLDDRDENAGIKFADNDLIGSPLQLIISPRNIKENKIEWKDRINKEFGYIELNNIISFIEKFVRDNDEK